MCGMQIGRLQDAGSILAVSQQPVNNREQSRRSLVSKTCEARRNLQSCAMRAVIQRVLEASVTIDNQTISQIGGGLLVLLGVEEADDPSDVEWLSEKIAKMRIFADSEDKMNLSLEEMGGSVLVVSQFTLHASTKKGNRPSFIRAAAARHSEPLYEEFCAAMERKTSKAVARGVFGGDMKVALINDGPVTILIDTKARE
jgi:D-tyrosyl-tRNA(Tyr) deacylase